MINNKKIAIVGGGPGGLTLARLLQLHHADVSVYERDQNRDVRQQGATLDLHEDSGLKAIEAAGLLDAFKAAYRPGADKMIITNQHAHVLFDDSMQKSDDDFGNITFRPEIDRGPLRDILIDALKPGTVVWNSKFVEMKSAGTGWEIVFENGATAYADLVVAADGANSRIRHYITDIMPVYSGVIVIEGNIYNAEKNAPFLHRLTNGGKVFALGSAKSIVLSAKGDGSLSFYTGTNEEENWVNTAEINFRDRKQVRDWFIERFSDWGVIWHELFESNEAYYIPRPMYHYPLNQSWTTCANLTMIGDAAHRMPPYAGEGVNMAMLDALELSQALLDAQHDLKTALSHFENQMCERASEVTRITLEQTKSIHSSRGLENMLEMFSRALAD